MFTGTLDLTNCPSQLLSLSLSLSTLRSFFFSARQTGKSTLLREQFPHARFVDLLAANFGDALEHLIATELTAFLSYTRSDFPLCYWRTTSQIEVDFIVGDSIAIEVKGAGQVK